MIENVSIFDLHLFNSFLLDGMLYYVSASHKLQVLSTDEEKKLAFRDVHDSDHGAHIGLNNTRVKLKTAFYWLGFEENQDFFSTNILKEHNYCLQINDLIHTNEEPCEEITSCSSTALNLGKRTHTKHTSLSRYDLGRKKIKVSEVRNSSSSPSNYNSNKILAYLEEKPVNYVLKSVESDFESIIKKSVCRRSELTKVCSAVSIASNFYSTLSTQSKDEALDILTNLSGWQDDILIGIFHFSFLKYLGFKVHLLLVL